MKKQIVTTNPATLQKIATYKLQDWNMVSKVLKPTPSDWDTDFDLRKTCISQLGKELTRTKDEMARIISEEMGKPLKQALGEIQKCAQTCEHFSQNADRLNQAKVELGKNEKVSIVLRPLGTILGIMPWNFPFWQVIRFAIPTLIIGNRIVIKHAKNTTGSALALQSLFEKCGFPKGVYQTVLVEHSVAEKMITDDRIHGVSLTGSTRAGIQISQVAALKLKKCVLELGGSDAYVIFKDADIEHAAKVCTQARLVNSGQSCVAGKRFIVEKAIAKSFTEAMVEEFKKQVVGDPFDDSTTVGPMARLDLRDQLKKQVAKTLRQGARSLFSSKIPKEGAYFPCMVLDKVQPGMEVFDEEIFGPVASIITAKSETDAIDLANRTQYGLGGGIFTSDLEKGEKLAIRNFNAGSVFINDHVRSHPAFPFGGIKMSGYGRELGEYGIREFANIKTIQVPTK